MRGLCQHIALILPSVSVITSMCQSQDEIPKVVLGFLLADQSVRHDRAEAAKLRPAI